MDECGLECGFDVGSVVVERLHRLRRYHCPRGRVRNSVVERLHRLRRYHLSGGTTFLRRYHLSMTRGSICVERELEIVDLSIYIQNGVVGRG